MTTTSRKYIKEDFPDELKRISVRICTKNAKESERDASDGDSNSNSGSQVAFTKPRFVKMLDEAGIAFAEDSEGLTVKEFLLALAKRVPSLISADDVNSDAAEDLIKFVVDGSEYSHDEFLVDIDDQWYSNSTLTVVVIDTPAQPEHASRASTNGHSAPASIKTATLPAPLQPTVQHDSLLQSSNGSVTAPVPSSSVSAALSSEGITWFMCNMGESNFPMTLFQDMNNDNALQYTVGHVKDILLAYSGADGVKNAAVMVATSRGVVDNDDACVADIWAPEIAAGQTSCVYFAVYKTTCQHQIFSPRTVCGDGDASEHGIQMLYAALNMMHARRNTDKTLRDAFLTRLLSITQCPPLVSATATYIDSPSSSKATLVLPFVFRGLATLCMDMLLPHAQKLARNGPMTLSIALEQCSLCFTAILIADPKSTQVTKRKFDFFEDFCKCKDAIPDREFVVLENNGNSEICERSVLTALLDTESPDRLIAGKTLEHWKPIVPKLVPDHDAKSIFYSFRSFTGSVLVVSPAAALSYRDYEQHRQGNPHNIITDLAQIFSRSRSMAFYSGLYTFISPRNLRQQRRPMLTLRGDGSIAIFMSLSKELSKVNVMDPTKPASADVAIDYEAESVLLSTYISSNPASFAASTLAAASGKLGAIPTTEDARPVQEAIVVLFDISLSMNGQSPFPGFTRNTLSKQCLRSFVDRLAAYDYPFRAQLVTFGSKSTVACSFTSIYSRFEATIESITPSGITALYDAIVKAVGALCTAYPGESVKRRIFVLSDGEDNCSSASIADVISAVHSNSVTVDSMCIGNPTDFTPLKGICLASGGLCFSATSAEAMFHMFESEPLLSIGCRPQPVPNRAIKSADDINALGKNATFSDMPARPHSSHITGEITSASAALVRAQRLAKSGNLTGGAFTKAVRALAAFEKDPHPNFVIYPSNEVFSFWMFILKGPEGTPYEGGQFLGYLQIPDDFPASPPTMRLVTPMYHCNVNSDGKICHSVLDRNWSADTPMRRVFDCIYGLLLHPDPDDPLDTFIASQFHSDHGAYLAKAAAMTSRHARKPLPAVLREIGNLSDRALDQIVFEEEKEYTCPLSQALFDDPVMTPAGATYSRTSILQYISEHGVDPDTKEPLDESQLTENKTVATMVAKFKKDREDAINMFTS